MRDQPLENASERPESPIDKESQPGSIYESIFLQAGVGMALVNNNGRFIRINAAFCRLIPYPEKTILNEYSLHELVGDMHEALLAKVMTGDVDTVQVKRPFSFLKSPPKWVHININKMNDGTDNLIVTLHETAPDQAIIESEEKYRLLFENAGEGFFSVDVNGVFLMMNKQTAKMLGGTPNQFVGRTLWDVFPKSSADLQMKEIRHVLNAESSHTVEIKNKLKEQTNWYRFFLQPIRDDSGNAIAVQGIAHDVTEQKRAKQELQLTKERLNLLHQIDQSILSAHTPGEIAKAVVNHLRHLFNCERVTILLFDPQKNEALRLATDVTEIADLFPEDRISLSSLTRSIEMLRNGVENIIDAEKVKAPSQNLQELVMNGMRSFLIVPIFGSDDVIGGFYLARKLVGGFTNDEIEMVEEVATQVSKAMQHWLLYESERIRRNESETLRTVTAALVSTLELDQVLQLILEQLANVVHYDSVTIFLIEEGALLAVAEKGLPNPDEVMGHSFPLDNRLFQSLAWKKKPVWLADIQVFDEFEGWGGTYQIRGWMGIPLFARGKLIGYLTIDSVKPNSYGAEEAKLVQPFADQAAQMIENARLYDQVQRHAEALEVTIEKLKSAQQQLVRQERLGAVGQLAAGIAHDFNNILSVILLYAQLLQHGSTLSIQDQERLGTIVKQSNRASQLIKQILDFSRKSVIERKMVRLRPFMVEIQELLQRMVPETVEISLQYATEDYIVYADPASLQQLLLNLALNARDAMPNGGVLRLKLNRYSFDKENQPPFAEMDFSKWVQICVSDTGIGMSPQIQAQLFEPFFTTKAPGKGTGLGLAQAYGIVRQHNGHIDFESVEGQGTTFEIYLPAQSKEAQAEGDAETAVLPGNGETILVVEDEDIARKVLSDILVELQYQVLTAKDGEVALAILKTHSEQISVVLSDVVMPKMGGIELYQKVGTAYPNLPVVLMSGYTKEDQIAKIEELILWLHKPFKIDELASVLQQALIQK
ncbi:MAG: GAF domain-containing protein [Chloroflexi bacterium]|nr:GAF domain-containing protein [Chloroflexota bacterium]